MSTKLPSALSRRPTANQLLNHHHHHHNHNNSPASLVITKSTTAPAAATQPSQRRCLSYTARRAADMIRRPKRPYTFTQLVQLSDGSTYTMRTTSPVALYRSQKDTRNHILWQPSEKSLQNVEVDEAGKLAAFRERFGRDWDAEKVGGDDVGAAGEGEKEVAGAVKNENENEGEKKTKKQQQQQEEQDEKDIKVAHPAGAVEGEKKGPTGYEGGLADLISSYSTSSDHLKDSKQKRKK
ncbi:hypothetical protein F4778DRAFT_713455 [Xylariomycetidae sp. FL2044]|nr:hypothetical protein F4778DRAFT_713455 [Xylariomycetidae sp. FL2044]